MIKTPLPQYPHLQPKPGVPAAIYVQIGMADVNLVTTSPTNWPARCGYVLFKTNQERTRPTRIVFTQKPIEGWRMGSVIDLYQSAKMNNLGEYMIVGVKDGPTGEHAGQIPDRLIKAGLVV